MTTIAGHLLDVRNGTQPIYNGFDNCLTFQIDEVRQQVHQNDTLIYDFERGLQGAALEMMLRGFRVDIDERERAIALTTQRRNDYKYILAKLLDAIPGPWTEKLVGSPTQLQELFYETMKLAPIAKHYNGERKLPMDRETLEKLQQTNKWADVLINNILWARDLSKTLQVLETEVRVGEPMFPGDLNWRWHCAYNIGGTSTGRWSSSKSPFGDGSNFQNISEELRRIFIPDPGMKLYGIDKAQSEARDVGWLCGLVFGDWSYLDACESGDLHTNVTKMLYPEWNWTDNPKLNRQLAERRFYRLFTFRDASKRLGHASNYFGKPREISRQTRIPLALVEEFQRRYFTAFPCIRQMHTWVAEQLQKHRYLVNSFGRRRDFFDHPKSDDTLKSAIAYLFQSATGDCLNLGLYRLWKKMGRRIEILSQLHDAVYFQAPIPKDDDEEQELLHEAVGCIEIEQIHRQSGRTMKIPGEVVAGYNWAHRYRLLSDGTKEEWNAKGLDGLRITA